MIEAPLPRSTRMALHTRVALIDTLLEEADQKRQALHHALAAQERAKEERQHAGHDMPLTPEGATLKYEQDVWQRVCTSLTTGAYPLGRSRGVGTAARAESVALQARPAAVYHRAL